jgi:hypothetical protein
MKTAAASPALRFGEPLSSLTWAFAVGVVAPIALGRDLGAPRR